MAEILAVLNNMLLNGAFDFSLNVVFNADMNTPTDDKALIESLGGPAKLAETLGYEKEGGIQRVQNWLTRGIPAAVKLERPDLFLPHLKQKRAPAEERRIGLPDTGHRTRETDSPSPRKAA